MGPTKQFDPSERLDRAVDAFWKNGFNGIGMQDLCRAMDLFPGSLYGTYGDKRQLFAQAVERRQHRFQLIVGQGAHVFE